MSLLVMPICGSYIKQTPLPNAVINQTYSALEQGWSHPKLIVAGDQVGERNSAFAPPLKTKGAV